MRISRQIKIISLKSGKRMSERGRKMEPRKGCWPWSWFFLLHLLLCVKASDKECSGVCSNTSDTVPLKFQDIVPANYDKLVPPRENGEAVTVQIKISILNIQFVDEVKQVFGADIFFHQFWTDNRVTIPPTYDTDRLVLDGKWRHHLWTPDTYFKNSLDGKVNDIIIPYSYMVADNRSNLFFAVRVSLKLSCEMDLTSYPHDVQQCQVIVMSLQHTKENVLLQWKEFQITKNLILSQYYVRGHKKENCTKTYNIGTFSCLVGTIQLARRLGYFLINKYIPCVLIVCMSFVTFWIPAEAYPARVTLSVTSLLTIVTQQYQSSMPSVSYVVALNIWMLSCIGFVFFSLLEYAFVIAVMNNKGTSLWPLNSLKPSSAPDGESGNNCATNGRNSIAQSRDNSSKLSHLCIDKTSRLIFPLFFIIFCVCYFGYFCR